MAILRVNLIGKQPLFTRSHLIESFGLLHSSGNAISGSFPAYQVYCGVDDCKVCFNSTQLSGSNPLPYARCSLQEASKQAERKQ